MVLIPHRRGDDGYFMLQLTPPGTAAGEGQLSARTLLPDGEPLELLILADTSASMDAASRERQAELVAALLAALTPKDRFNLATCDVDCDWVFDQAAPGRSEERRPRPGSSSPRRESLGWTDLDKAMPRPWRSAGRRPRWSTSATASSPPATAIRWPSPSGCGGWPRASRARSMPWPPSSSFEPGVLKAIASLGGGSFRQISGSHGPRPWPWSCWARSPSRPLRDVKVEFRGLRTARVYPEELPNLPPGTQQIILGRYLPQGRDQTGEVIVTGTAGAASRSQFTANAVLA